MVSIFTKRDPRSREGGFSFQIIPNEFKAKSKQKRSKIHIHVWKGFKGNLGDVRVYLFPIWTEEKTRGIERNKWGDIEKFVEWNLTFIKNRVREELEKIRLGYLLD